MLAPNSGRLGEFGQRIDLAAERASAAFASRRSGVGRKEEGSRGHLNVSLARLMNWTAIATDPGWQVLKGPPGVEVASRTRNAAGPKFAERISFACLWAFERSSGNRITLMSEVLALL
jgi:hypothetical protein